MPKKIGLTLLLLIPLALICWQFLSPPARPPATAPLVTATTSIAPAEEFTTLYDLARSLASDDPARQHAAQSALAAVPYRKRSALRSLADQTTDESVKTLLLHRLAEIDELLATQPPPISLHVKDASLQEVADALNEEMGTSLQILGSDNSLRYNVDLTDQPFWQVIRALNDLHPLLLTFTYATGELQLNEVWPAQTRFHIVGNFAFFTSTPASSPDLPRDLLELGLAADPRMPLFRIQYDLSFGTDDAGQPVHSNILAGQASTYALHGFSKSLQLTPAAQQRHTWSFVKVDARFSVARATLEVQIEHPENGFDLTLGTTHITGKPFVQGANSASTDFFASTPDNPFLYATLHLYDAAGTPIANTHAPGSGTLDFPTERSPPPFTLKISLPNTIRETAASFELKDIPLP